MYIKNWNLKKAVGITIKSKQTNNQLKPVTRNAYGPSCISYCYNSEPNGCVHIKPSLAHLQGYTSQSKD